MHVLRRSWSCPQVTMSVGERIARWTLARQYDLERELQWKPAMLLGMECQDGALVPRLDAEVRDPEGGTQPPAFNSGGLSGEWVTIWEAFQLFSSVVLDPERFSSLDSSVRN
ncbi:MAG: hypothetical protein ACK58T_07330, partial [Phycisphaerae bacterium]